MFRDKKDENATFMKEFEKAAIKMEGKIAFAYAGMYNRLQFNLANFLEVKQEEFPILTALRPNEHIRYHSPMKPDLMQEDYMIRWVDSVVNRVEKPWVRSQDETQDKTSPITKIVGTNLDKITKDPTKEVFVDFYAPWCGHCTRLAPTWEQVAYYFQYDQDLLIANFDCTQNDVVGDWIKAYPTMYFYPKGTDKTPIEYNGERTFEGFKKWLFEHSEVLKNRGEFIKEDL